MIFTHEKGKPLPKPHPRNFKTLYDFIVAYHEWKRKIESTASNAVYTKGQS